MELEKKAMSKQIKTYIVKVNNPTNEKLLLELFKDDFKADALNVLENVLENGLEIKYTDYSRMKILLPSLYIKSPNDSQLREVVCVYDTYKRTKKYYTDSDSWSFCDPKKADLEIREFEVLESGVTYLESFVLPNSSVEYMLSILIK